MQKRLALIQENRTMMKTNRRVLKDAENTKEAQAQRSERTEPEPGLALCRQEREAARKDGGREEWAD